MRLPLIVIAGVIVLLAGVTTVILMFKVIHGPVTGERLSRSVAGQASRMTMLPCTTLTGEGRWDCGVLDRRGPLQQRRRRLHRPGAARQLLLDRLDRAAAGPRSARARPPGRLRAALAVAVLDRQSCVERSRARGAGGVRRWRCGGRGAVEGSQEGDGRCGALGVVRRRLGAGAADGWP
jgi:hypothetical protein